MAAKTRALEVLNHVGIAYELLTYTAHTDHFGDHAVEELGVDPALTLKTLVVHHGRDFAVCCVPVSAHLSLKKAANALGWKNAEMADPKDAQRLTGYVIGGISPVGTTTALRTLIDDSVRGCPAVSVSGGQRGLSVRLRPSDLADVAGAEFCDLMA